MTELEKFGESIKRLSNKYKELDILTISRDKEGNFYIGGTMCFVCGLELLKEFIIEKGLTHDNEDTEGNVH